MLKFVYKGMMKMKIGEYNVEVRRSKRKSAAIKITADMQIVVFVPLYVSDNEIERMVISKSKCKADKNKSPTSTVGLFA